MRTFHTGGVAGLDITAGLPRVEELFEARVPKGKAEISHIDGIVEIIRDDTRPRSRSPAARRTTRRSPSRPGPSCWPPPATRSRLNQVDRPPRAAAARRHGSRSRASSSARATTLVVRAEDVVEREYIIPHNAKLMVENGQEIRAGDAITDGPINPQEYLDTRGKDAVQRYLVKEVQKVYRSQGVTINDKHIEIIVRQMLRKVRIDQPGDVDLLPTELIDRLDFEEVNNRVLSEGGEPATAQTVLLGVTKASLNTSSFLAAASFQETTRVLTEAAINGAKDHLIGLKENVIIGKLIPAGTGAPANVAARPRARPSGGPRGPRRRGARRPRRGVRVQPVPRGWRDPAGRRRDGRARLVPGRDDRPTTTPTTTPTLAKAVPGRRPGRPAGRRRRAGAGTTRSWPRTTKLAEPRPGLTSRPRRSRRPDRRLTLDRAADTLRVRGPRRGRAPSRARSGPSRASRIRSFRSAARARPGPHGRPDRHRPPATDVKGVASSCRRSASSCVMAASARSRRSRRRPCARTGTACSSARSRFPGAPQKRGVCLQVRTMTPEEAELGPSQDRPRAADQPDGGHGLHPGHRPQPPGALGGPRPRRPGEGPAVGQVPHHPGHPRRRRRARPQAGPQQVRRQGQPAAGRARSRCPVAPASPARPSTRRIPANRTDRPLQRQADDTTASATWPSGSSARRSPGPRPRPTGRGSRSSRRRCATRRRSSKSSPAASVAPPTRSRSRSAATAACRSACAGSSRPPASATARA